MNLIRAHVPPLSECRALVVGAGAAGKLAARALRDHGVRRITVTSRTERRAEEVAAYLEGAVLPFSRLADGLAEADLVITCSSAPGFVVALALVEEAVSRRTTPITFMDVAVPRDVDPKVGEIPGVRLFDIDNLQAVSEANLKLREEAAEDVRAIVRRAARDFDDWLDGRRAVPTIKALVQRAEAVRHAELERTLRELRLDAQTADKLDRMTAAIVKKLLHEPIAYLRYADDSWEASANRPFHLWGRGRRRGWSGWRAHGPASARRRGRLRCRPYGSARAAARWRGARRRKPPAPSPPAASRQRK